ncbi:MULTISPECIES: 3,4-dihydroxy-2-butanone-4-phosphate synthase [unclassified Gilliamella]|uniref:3,4-dihydroxy-2-butanone-4-phosphate synthase n=1 Tax=unclassified Gilliamella TaxID=2685620 RepID=UPI0022699E8D|nr:MULTISPECIES: 3,4-dihydroxy-2-butanone-4-phosphate synthase [unclassified Gilliamella]MCX8585097.1 3,4-dihydroxy-2-butanone-4-phosphate synthase [Gilliamella sp. B3562]MCX8596730.1 3,4-dihydroxy-2-butanone-4-phosphate synthase [Gilliamella sp. B3493]MCX8598458.1 3,4-dihydroxy-2-butanone-4-phosphate synthase [Gilliamella sp. B3486]MCX8685238.1 3,4-dihydroxy-2-butanone-4-phosphate synthase [Gilliamella sp. B2864]MCX8688391.1 3,4-dihydroxy-2-butanone-4-phosphate synthase [Gilliamella sp. B2973
MNQFNLNEFGTPIERVKKAIASIKAGSGVLVLDDEDRENEGDIIWAAQTITTQQMALTIRYGSGIVCLCMPQSYCDKLELPMMVTNNTSKNQTAFTITIEAAKGVTTGVSAADRVTTVKAAVADNAKPSDLNHPGHVFPLVAKENGVFSRRGHTEASVDLVSLAGFKPAAVICELTNDDGTMARAPQVVEFAKKHQLPVVTIDDIVAYRKSL